MVQTILAFVVTSCVLQAIKSQNGHGSRAFAAPVSSELIGG